MGEILQGFVAVILLGVHIYLLMRWEKVKRPKFFLLGLGGIKIMILSALFMLGAVGGGWQTFGRVVFILGLLCAYGGVFGGCYPGKLPVWDSITFGSASTQADQQSDSAQGV